MPERMRAQGLADPYRVVKTYASVPLGVGADSTLGTVFYRDGAEDNITLRSRLAGDGLILPETAAQRLDIAVGDDIGIGAASVPVVGVYVDLFEETSVRPFWCSYTSLFLNRRRIPRRGGG